MDCKELERLWQKDKERWEEEKARMTRLLEEQEQEILDLKRKLSLLGTEDLRKQLSLLQEKLRRCQEALERPSPQAPPLGEVFFQKMAQALALWDQTLLEEARGLEGAGVREWLKALWREREEALGRALEGGEADWRRLYTGLVLEWAFLAWLEGVRDA